MFYDILQGLCRKEGLSVSAALKIMGISSGNISHWKKGKLPSARTVRRIAQFFTVPADYLIGKKQNDYASQQSRLLAAFAAVPEQAREQILTQFEESVHAVSEKEIGS